MYGAFPDLLLMEEEIRRAESALSGADEAESIRLAARLEALHRRYAQERGLIYRGLCREMLLDVGFTEQELSLRVGALSGGQHTRLALARLLAMQPDILLLDEPTNHLDVKSLAWLQDFLASYPKTLLLISHDRYFLDRVAGKILVVENGTARLYHGNYTETRKQRESEAEALLRRYKEQQKQIAKIEANIDFQRRCGQEHNFVTIRSKEKQLARMERVELAPPPPRAIRFSFAFEENCANEVLEAKHLTFAYPGASPLFQNLSFLLRRGRRVLFLGENGCGKSTLMKILVQRLAPTGGSLRLGYNVKLGYYDQENDDFRADATVFSELSDTYPTKTDFELRSTLALFGFTGEDAFRPVRVLSGGERARLTLAKLVLQKVNLLILDEPTNHLDITSREVLENSLCDFPGTVIAVSHDRYFIDRVATDIAELSSDGIRFYPVDGDRTAYETYLAATERRAATEVASTEKTPAPPSDGKLAYEEKKKRDAEKRQRERRLAAAERRIPELEGEIERIKQELYGDAAADYVRAAALQKSLDDAESELLALYELTM
jgi:ATP-binding cassette subfamily F protein 3